eukprot:6475229-Amphidinium_carterae.2
MRNDQTPNDVNVSNQEITANKLTASNGSSNLMWSGAQRSQITSLGKRIVPRGSVGLSACSLNSLGKPYAANAGAIAITDRFTVHEVEISPDVAGADGQ